MPYILLFLLGIWIQEIPPLNSLSESGCIATGEEVRLSAEGKIDKRIKMYREISERLHKAVEDAIKKQNPDQVSELLSCWGELLEVSLKDIDANIDRKKKSGALKDYEIHLRKSILDMGDTRLRAEYEQQGLFRDWLAKANYVHEEFIDIMFQR
jgi:hypothetical protein